MKINILDAGLREIGGHHFDHDRNLARYLVEAGHDVHIYGFAGMHDDVFAAIEPICPVTKLFQVFHYKPAKAFDSYAGELVLFAQQAPVLAEDLKLVREADLWVWPSIRPQHLMACAWAGTKAAVVGGIHEDPGIAVSSIGAQLWRLAMLEAKRLKLNYTVGSVEPELRHRFMEILPDGRFVILPHPYDGTPIAEPRTELKRIGFFGAHRVDQGVDVLSKLITNLVEGGFEIVLQDSSELPKTVNHSAIEVLGYVDDLNVPLATCDLVVLPYDVEGYRSKGSGILAHCLILGIPVVGPYGTIPGRIIEQYNVGPLFGRSNAQAILGAIKFAEANYATFAANAFKRSRQYSKRMGIANYAAAVLGCA